MIDAGNNLLAEVMLWLMYIAVGLAVIAVIVSAVRSFWMENRR